VSDHVTCEDPTCVICQERERIAALKIERGLRPTGNLRLTVAKIKERARQLRARTGHA